MTDLKPVTALGDATPRRLSAGALTLCENDAVAFASLALRRGTGRPAPFGLALPGPGGWAAGQGVAALWVAPDQWLVEAEGRAATDFAATLGQAAPGCSVTEQTDGWVAFEIVSQAGPRPLEALLEKLVNVDPAGFAPGRATRTALHHMSCYLVRREAGHVAVLGARSSAGSLWHALATAARRLHTNAA